MVVVGIQPPFSSDFLPSMIDGAWNRSSTSLDSEEGFAARPQEAQSRSCCTQRTPGLDFLQMG
ncbi:hypothetical protein PF003_g20811 [Phytophthora fragariae]|nr:hypothetical protein PF003_g20811 [Phytophthora fragariae]